MIFLFACTESLVPGELVLGQDVPAEFSYGSENARFGASVAWSESGLLVGAPGERVARLNGEELPGPYEWVGWWGESFVQADGNYIWVDGELRLEVEKAFAWAAGEAGLYMATPESIVRLDVEWVIKQKGVVSLASGQERLLAVICDGECGAFAFTPEGVPLGRVAEAGQLGAVAEWNGVAWAGAPDWETDKAPGKVCSEEGVCVEGLEGDHLGRAVGGGFTVGMFNKEITPPRARIVPLEGGTVYVMEEGAELQEIAVGGGEGRLVVGAPYVAYGGLPAGVVVEAGVP